MGVKRIRDPKACSRYSGSACIICGKPGDCAHIKSRGAGGDDTDNNMISLCRWHHRVQHAWGWPRFIDAWPEVGRALKDRGWHVVEEFGVWRLRRV